MYYNDSDDYNFLNEAYNDYTLSESRHRATPEGDTIINQVINREFLSEAYSTSQVRVDKNTKVKRVTAAAAFVIAREADDPLYKKLAVINKKRAELKKAIEKKYSQKAKARAREIMSGRNLKTGQDMPSKDPNSRAKL